MHRRSFLRLAVGGVIALPAGRFLVACASDDAIVPADAPPADSPAAPPRADGTSIIYSSSEVASHFHTFTLAMASLTSPPAGGVSGDTDNVASHTHTLSISMAQLASAAAGQTIKITTGSVASHTHVITLVKLSTSSSTGGGGGGAGGGGGGGAGYPYPY